MADIVFRYPEMRAAAASIQGIAGRYKAAAAAFESDFTAAISGWEGESKDKMQAFISGSVKEYTHDTVPQLLEALASLLNSNADQMENADRQIAENIPG
jgi:WXG100 family type VII secretion target